MAYYVKKKNKEEKKPPQGGLEHYKGIFQLLGGFIVIVIFIIWSLLG